MATLVAPANQYAISSKIQALYDTVFSQQHDLYKREQAVLEVGDLLSKSKLYIELGCFIKRLQPFLEDLSKIKAAKLLKALIDAFLNSSALLEDQAALCHDCIKWAEGNGHSYLRQSLESRLINILYTRKDYRAALEISTKLLYELKKIDDKDLLVYVHLQESKIYYDLGNVVRSRSSLIAAKTTANGIYCPPHMQGHLELQSGIIHSVDEQDFKLAFSYFYEAFDNFDRVGHPMATSALKYMIMAKIMLLLPDEIPRIMSDKITANHTGREVESMLKFGSAVKQKSLSEFNNVFLEYKDVVELDPIIFKHLQDLKETLFEQNLLRIIEPFSSVQISHISRLINLPMELVEIKLSQMVLDGMINGILDQNNNSLIVNTNCETDNLYKSVYEMLEWTECIINRLFIRAQKLK